jgi:hypothetical protein
MINTYSQGVADCAECRGLSAERPLDPENNVLMVQDELKHGVDLPRRKAPSLDRGFSAMRRRNEALGMARHALLLSL